MPWSLPGAGWYTAGAGRPYTTPAGARVAISVRRVFRWPPLVDGAVGAGCRSPGGRSLLGSWFLYVAGSRPHIRYCLLALRRSASVRAIVQTACHPLRRRAAGGNCSWGRSCYLRLLSRL